jgi:hypothetical protein
MAFGPIKYQTAMAALLPAEENPALQNRPRLQQSGRPVKHRRVLLKIKPLRDSRMGQRNNNVAVF